MAYSPVGVWTKCTDPEFLRLSGGISDRLIHVCKDQEEAWRIEGKLREIYRDQNLFTRAV